MDDQTNQESAAFNSHPRCLALNPDGNCAAANSRLLLPCFSLLRPLPRTPLATRHPPLRPVYPIARTSARIQPRGSDFFSRQVLSFLPLQSSFPAPFIEQRRARRCNRCCSPPLVKRARGWSHVREVIRCPTVIVGSCSTGGHRKHVMDGLP